MTRLFSHLRRSFTAHLRRSFTALSLLSIVNSATAQIDSFPMPPLKFAPNGDLIITASPESSGKDFDFFVGKWKMKNKHLNARLANCKEYTEFESTVEDHAGLEGNGNFDVVHRQLPDGKIYEGRTVRTFDPKTRLWRLYWMDSNGGPIDPPQIGSFHNGVGLFFAKDYQVGRPVIIVFRWDITNPNQPVWGQAFSDDNGKTWEWNYSNTSYRAN
ncbi:MAG TPA: hypothetical protein VG101_12025 [Puia sp.]|jgi:hypothetical protein|nr:hypothetical protein [Puia sp.]